ncbi:hypothetical protein N7539_001224 [Penicillium diatomitis]|uniref:Uncharacterized protein n=1 Tax=Penicillium diatomitis TaxID=2819901 RepID=A0A9W9XND0_9EURO|nr:uncharacterized protein N7539_001224 [Penicillium diatomitis]KAJ5496108.1 hypothetical protein N7539_001224 [Penicillium diatomitis]
MMMMMMDDDGGGGGDVSDDARRDDDDDRGDATSTWTGSSRASESELPEASVPHLISGFTVTQVLLGDAWDP